MFVVGKLQSLAAMNVARQVTTHEPFTQVPPKPFTTGPAHSLSVVHFWFTDPGQDLNAENPAPVHGNTCAPLSAAPRSKAPMRTPILGSVPSAPRRATIVTIAEPRLSRLLAIIIIADSAPTGSTRRTPML